MLRKVAFNGFLSERQLAEIDFEPQLASLRELLRQGPLSSLDPLVAIDAYAHSEGKRARFGRRLTRLEWDQKPDWKDRTVQATINDLFSSLDKLQWEDLEVSFSSRHQEATWAFNTSAAYFPLKRRVRVYVVGSSKCPALGRSKTLSLSLKGSVEVTRGGSGNRRFSVSLDDIQFKCRGCVLSLTGRWTDRFLSPRGFQVSISNHLDLLVKGEKVSGQLTQEHVSTDEEGKVSGGRLVLEVNGQVSQEGELNAQLIGEPNPRALGWMGPIPAVVKATLTGTIRKGVARGQLSGAGLPRTLNWVAK